jgi:hypothetical protein
MFEMSNAASFWVDVTNVVLGLTTLLCLIVVGSIVVKEVLARIAKRVHVHDPHVLEVPELGLTMTDGGEKLYDDDERAFG